jgi:hypothetical protein
MSEKIFQDDVRNYLRKLGHEIINMNGAVFLLDADKSYKQYADVISTYEKILFITEVKLPPSAKQLNSSLQNGIGQLILHQYSRVDNNRKGEVIYQLALPDGIMNKISMGLINYLRDILHIEIIFVEYSRYI